MPKPTGGGQANRAAPYKSRTRRDSNVNPDSGSLVNSLTEHEYDEQQAHLNGELETLRHRYGDDHAYDFSNRHLRPTSIQTMNSYISSSTHTTNTNSATSPGFAQHASPSLNFVRSRESSITSETMESPQSSTRAALWASQKTTGQAHSRSFSVEEKSAGDPDLVFPPSRNLFRSVSNSNFSMQRKNLPIPQQHTQLQAQFEQSRSQPQHHKLLEEAHQAAPKPTQRSSNAVVRYMTDKPLQPRSLPVSARSASQPRAARPGPPTELGTRYNTPRSVRSTPKSSGRSPQTPTQTPAPNPTPGHARSFTSPASISRHHQTAVGRPHVGSGGATARPASITQSVATDRRVSLQAPSHKRQSMMETPSMAPAPATAPAGPTPVATPANRLPARVSSAPGAAGNLRRAARLSIQRQSLKEETSFRPCNIPNDIHTPQSQPNSLPSNPLPTTGHPPIGYQCNLKASVGDERRASLVRIPTRQESTEELVQYLERLIGYDDLRLLADVDKLRHLSSHPNTEHGKAGLVNPDHSHSNRKSIGNGLLGRLGWKHKRLSSCDKNKLLHRNESVNSDRRGTFGLWGSGQSRTMKGSVFGCPLEDSDAFSCVTVIGGQKHLIPIIIFFLIEEIYARGMRTPGFMRIAGKTEKIDALAEIFERPPFYGDGTDLSGEDIHVLCSLFKRYLRALPEPLMSRELFHILWSHCVRQPAVPDQDNLQNAISTSQCLMRLMPPRSFSLFIYVVAFLSQIPLFPQNKFSLTGIAKVFGPALFSPRTQRKGVDERPMHALKWLLENWSLITEGILDEYFTVKLPQPPPSRNLSDENAECLEINSPTHLDDTPVVPDNLSHCSHHDSWTPGSLSLQLSRSVALLDWQSNSLRRNSVSSAQHIVDRYEAKEKTLAEVHLTAMEIDTPESHPEAYETVALSSMTGPFIADKPVRLGLPLAGIAEVTDTHPVDEHTNACEKVNVPQTSSTFNHSLKLSVLVLNEPPEPARPVTEPPIRANSLPEDCKTTNDSNTEGEPFCNPQASQVLDLTKFDEKLTQNIQDITSGLRVDQDTGNPLESVVRKTLLMIERHQTLLSDMRSQLNELLRESLTTVKTQRPINP